MALSVVLALSASVGIDLFLVPGSLRWMAFVAIVVISVENLCWKWMVASRFDLYFKGFLLLAAGLGIAVGCGFIHAGLLRAALVGCLALFVGSIAIPLGALVRLWAERALHVVQRRLNAGTNRR